MFLTQHSIAARAILTGGEAGARLLHDWLATVDFENAGNAVWRLSPLLHQMASEHGLVHPLLPRLKGITRYFWLSHELRMRALYSLLDAIDVTTPVVLLASLATLARFGDASLLWTTTHGELLVSPARARGAVVALTQAGWIAPSFDPATDAGSFLDQGVMRVIGGRNHFDVHWQPVRGLSNPDLPLRIIARAQTLSFGEAPRLVPALCDHLLLLLTYRTHDGVWPIDMALEAALLLARHADDIEWSCFHDAVRIWGLDTSVRPAVSALERDLAVPVPQTLRRQG